MELQVWTLDVSQAYIQIQNMNRNVYLKPHRTFQLANTSSFNLQKPRHGLPVADEYWSMDFN